MTVSIQHLDELWLEACGPLQRLCGRLPRDLRLCETIEFAGVGEGGHLVASALAASRGKDTSFLRLTPKLHGLRRQWEGVIKSGHPVMAVCREKDTAFASTHANALGIELAGLIVFTERHHVGHFSPFEAETIETRASKAADLEREVFQHSGAFTTSSGHTVTRYFETLPAASSYHVVLNADRHVGGRVAVCDHVIGIAYGGTYFAVVLSLIHGQQPQHICLNDGDCSNLVLSPNDKIVFVDDFVTTGDSFAKGLRLTSPSSHNELSFISLYGLNSALTIAGTGRFVEIVCTL